MRRGGNRQGSSKKIEAAKVLVVVGALGIAASLGSSAQAQSFVQTFDPATCNSGALASDAVGDENPSRIDAVGNATYAAALYAHDASFYYMRQRLAASPTGPGGFASHAWSWGIDTDGDEANGFELVASLDGVPELVKLSLAGSSTPAWSASTATHADTVAAGSSVGGGTDWFLTIAIPIQELNDNGASGSLKIWLGSSANASGIDKDWACFAGLPASPADVPVDPVDVPTKCTTDGDCGGTTPVCAAVDELCVACSTDAECSGIDPGKPICGAVGACVAGCLVDGDCAPALPRCDSGTNQCVECLADGDCSTGSPFCDGGTSECRGCASDVECETIDPSLPQCLPAGSCAECEFSADCGIGEACDTGSYSCIAGCLDATDCPLGSPICDTSSGSPGMCVACLNDELGLTPDSGCATPALPLCDSAAGSGGLECVFCVDDAAGLSADTGCSALGTPVCDESSADGSCVECLAHQHCAGFELCVDSMCEPPDHDGDGTDDAFDSDSDNDGIPDDIEGDGVDRSGDSDMDGIPDYTDPDSITCVDANMDGVCDVLPAEVDGDADGVPNHLDTDSDDDGIPDAVEGDVDTDGDDLSNYLDDDSDDDGIGDALEGHDVDGDGMADTSPLGMDGDNDGLDDAYDGDMAGGMPAPTPDHDDDGIPDFLDADDDGDGIDTEVECADPSAGCPDSDDDGRPDYLDSPQLVIDTDGDGLTDDVPASGFSIQGGRGVGCHVGVTRQGGPTGVLLLVLALCLGIRRYRRN